MQRIAIGIVLFGVSSCSSTATEISSPPIHETRADALWVTLSKQAADAVAAAIARGDLPGTAERIAQGTDAEAWHFEGLDPSDLSRFLHETFHRCGGFVVHATQAEAEDALDDSVDHYTEGLVETYTVDQGEIVNALLPNVDATRVHDTIAHLSSYTNRYYQNASGAEAARWIRDTWRSLTSRTDVTVELFQHRDFDQPSVIMTIPGERTPDEIVVLGAHLDSIAGWSTNADTHAPGADDDASGIASLTEAMRILFSSGFRPARTLKIMGYAGEEVGLLGSAEIAKKFATDRVNVVGVLQLDMTNYRDAGSDEIVLISDYTNATQNAFLGSLIDTYIHLSWGQMKCEYACSDHASWTKRGFISSFPFETHDYNPRIHTADDTLGNSVSDATHAAKFSRIAIAYMVELAKGSITAP